MDCVVVEPCPPKRYVQVLISSTWLCDLIWKQAFADVISSDEVILR